MSESIRDHIQDFRKVCKKMLTQDSNVQFLFVDQSKGINCQRCIEGMIFGVQTTILAE
jgi:hypothetical protein